MIGEMKKKLAENAEKCGFELDFGKKFVWGQFNEEDVLAAWQTDQPISVLEEKDLGGCWLFLGTKKEAVEDLIGNNDELRETWFWAVQIWPNIRL